MKKSQGGLIPIPIFIKRCTLSDAPLNIYNFASMVLHIGEKNSSNTNIPYCMPIICLLFFVVFSRL